ncbi:type II toxin-antitoxin system VapB family antitoxin [Microbacterium sp. 18062]|uniref:type II toxin-antitoxin system VapB family antitoxin n=1 Tax=Microbacterium sp. 18062 TaxID=2681410 RepID=UPI00135716F9|nr:type II toxin-antitoxin system VapB family antitoxin [Microbacterium sp. 18062]
MSLNIKNPAVLELTRDLARLLGTSQVGALEVALREKLAREQAGDDVRREQIRRDLVEIRERLRGGPTRQQIDDDLYDEWGLPR